MKRTLLVFTVLAVSLIPFIFSFKATAKEVSFTLEDRDRLIRVETTIREFKDAVDKRFEQIDKRIMDLRQDMNSRFQQIDKRFELFDKRFEQTITFMWMLVVIFVGMTGATISFALWDRRTMIRPFEVKTKEIEEKITEMDVGKLANLISSLREIAKADMNVAKALRKFNLL